MSVTTRDLSASLQDRVKVAEAVLAGTAVLPVAADSSAAAALLPSEQLVLPSTSSVQLNNFTQEAYSDLLKAQSGMHRGCGTCPEQLHRPVKGSMGFPVSHRQTHQ